MKTLSAKEVAELFGVSEATVHNWRNAELIPYTGKKLPGQTRGRYRYPASAIKKLLKESRLPLQAVSSE